MASDKNKHARSLLPLFAMGCVFVLIDLLALLVVQPFVTAGVVAFPDPNDPWNIVFFFSTLLVFTALILLIVKFWKKQAIQFIILGSTGLLAFFVLYPLLIIVLPEASVIVVSAIAVVALIALLVKRPEWYVIDTCCVLVGVGAMTMLGISLNILLTIVLLAGLAVYDAISVYKTKHMIDLADAVLDLKLPIMFVIPKKRNYSLIKETKSLKEKLKDQEEREAFFVGLGDVVMPGILFVSTFINIADQGLLVALSVLLGTLAGFAVLLFFVVKGKPQAGLPFLCTGAILGYLISSYLLFGQLIGLTLA